MKDSLEGKELKDLTEKEKFECQYMIGLRQNEESIKWCKENGNNTRWDQVLALDKTSVEALFGDISSILQKRKVVDLGRTFMHLREKTCEDPKNKSCCF